MEDTTTWWMLLRTLGSLAFIVVLLFGLAYLTKRYFRPERWGLQLSGIRILQSLPLDTKRKLIIVEIEGRRLLLGVGQDSIQMLSELEPSQKISSTPKEIGVASYAKASS